MSAKKVWEIEQELESMGLRELEDAEEELGWWREHFLVKVQEVAAVRVKLARKRAEVERG